MFDCEVLTRLPRGGRRGNFVWKVARAVRRANLSHSNSVHDTFTHHMCPLFHHPRVLVEHLSDRECVCGSSRPFSFESGRLVVRPRPQCNIQVFHLGRSYSAVSGTILRVPPPHATRAAQFSDDSEGAAVLV